MNTIVMLNVDNEINGMVSFLKDTFKLKIGRNDCEKLFKAAYDYLKSGVANAGVTTETSTLKMFIDNRLIALMNQLETPLTCAMDSEFVALNKVHAALGDSQLQRNVKQGKSQRQIEKKHKVSFKGFGHAVFKDNENVMYDCQFKTLQKELTPAMYEKNRAEFGWNMKKQILRSVFKQLLQVACHEAAENVKREVIRLQKTMNVEREKGMGQIHQTKIKSNNKFVSYALVTYNARGRLAVGKNEKTALIKSLVNPE